MQGICTSPQTGSQVSPRKCSSAISAAYSICDGRTAEQLAGRSGRHGAGNAHFTLTPHFGTRNGGIRLGNVAEQSRRGQRMENPDRL